MFCDFIKDVNDWLSDAGHLYVQSNDNAIQPPDNQSVSSDEVNPEDNA